MHEKPYFSSDLTTAPNVKRGSSAKRFVMLAVTIATALTVALLVMRFEIKSREESYRLWQQEHFSERKTP